MCARPSGASRPRPPRLGWRRRICIPPSDWSDFTAALQFELSQLNTNIGRTWGVGPSISWTFPNMAAPRARVRQAKAEQAAALASFDAVVLTALKETEQALALYSAALDNRQALGDAQDKIHTAFGIAQRSIPRRARSATSTCSPRNNRWSRSTPRWPHPMPPWFKTKSPFSRRWAAGGSRESEREPSTECARFNRPDRELACDSNMPDRLRPETIVHRPPARVSPAWGEYRLQYPTPGR